MIGSPNFSNRSVTIDLESQVVIITTQPALASQFKKEANQIFSCGNNVEKVDWQEESRRLPLPIAALYKLFGKKFM